MIGLTPVEKTEDMEDWVWNLCADVALRPVSRVVTYGT